MVRACKLAFRNGHVVTVTFSNGRRRTINMDKYLRGPILDEIRTDLSRFRELKIVDGALTWPGGFDICPDVLYYDLPLAGEPLTDASSRRLRRFLEAPDRFEGRAAVTRRPRLRSPDISWFMGITISIEFEKRARPHFRARYGDTGARFGIDPFRLLDGSMSPTAIEFVREWASLQQEELAANWNRARRGLPLKPIAPLE